MMKQAVFYRNEQDNTILAVINGSADKEISYSGQKLTPLIAGSVDAAREKHVPAAEVKDGRIYVEVGSVIHPMEQKHYIEWIAFVSDKDVDIHYLDPGEAPKAEFEGTAGTVYAYCNLHGLWKTEIA